MDFMWDANGFPVVFRDSMETTRKESDQESDYFGRHRNYGDKLTLLLEAVQVMTLPEWIGLTMWIPVLSALLGAYTLWG